MLVREVAPNVSALTVAIGTPGVGTFSVSAYLFNDDEPMLVDAGGPIEVDEFVGAVAERVDLNDLRWIYLTHADHDHTGALAPLLERAPNAKVVLTFGTLTVLLASSHPIPLARARLVSLGTRATLGSREITPMRPPTFDQPGTAGCFDHGTGIFCSADFMGASASSMEDALADDAAAVAPAEYAAGLLMWASTIAPWVHLCDQRLFEDALDAVRALQPSVVLPVHGPPVRDTLDHAIDVLRGLPRSEPAPPPPLELIESAIAMMNDEMPEQTSA